MMKLWELVGDLLGRFPALSRAIVAGVAGGIWQGSASFGVMVWAVALAMDQ